MLRYALLGSALLFCVQSAVAVTAGDIRTLLEEGKSAQAYELAKQSPQSLGDADFDFYFGIVAIDTGHAGEGVLALERYSLTYPNNQSARLQLARGYFALGEDARAREEFQAVRAMNPPPDVLSSIDGFLDQIRLRESRYMTTAAFFVETGFGIDTNINAGVSNPNVSLPNLGTVIISPTGTKRRDTLLTLGAGGYVSKPVAPGISLVGNGQFEFRRVQSQRELSQGNYSLSGGVSMLQEKNLYRVGLDANLITIGRSSEKFRTYYGISGDIQHQIDEKQSMSVGAQYGALRYSSALAPKDGTATGLSFGYRRLVTHPWQPVLALGLNFSRERALDSTRDDLSSNTVGAKFGMTMTPAPKFGLGLGYNIQRTQYLGADAFLATKRNDQYQSLDATLTYLYSRALSFRVEASASRNRSNIAIYTFPREALMFKARYEFK